MVQAISTESTSSVLYQQLMSLLAQSSNNSNPLGLNSKTESSSTESIEDKFLNFLQKGFDKIDKNQDNQITFEEIGDFVGEKVENAVDKVAEFAGNKLQNFVSNADSPFNGFAKFDFSNFAENLGQTVINAYKNQSLLSNIANSAINSVL